MADAKIVHFEIPADDTQRAREFWSSMFGIEWQTYEGPTEYHMFANEDKQTGGGLGPRQEGDEGLRVYFSTEDMDAALDRVRELGGTVDGEKSPVPKMGWLGHARDTEGNQFSFWQNDENAPEPAGMQTGEAASS